MFINLPYIALSVFYFYGQMIPFVLTITLVLFLALEYRGQIRQINNARKIDEAVAINTKIGRVTEFWSMTVYAIHIAYLL